MSVVGRHYRTRNRGHCYNNNNNNNNNQIKVLLLLCCTTLFLIGRHYVNCLTIEVFVPDANSTTNSTQDSSILGEGTNRKRHLSKRKQNYKSTTLVDQDVETTTTRRRIIGVDVLNDTNVIDNNDNEEEEESDTDWQTTYDADVTPTSGQPLLAVPSVEFILVSQQQQQSGRRQRRLQGDGVMIETITRTKEIFYKTSVSYRRIGRSRKETMWTGTLRMPSSTSITSTTTSDNNETSTTASRSQQNTDSNIFTRSRDSSKNSSSIDYRTGYATIYERDGLIRAATFTTETTVYELVYTLHDKKYEIRSSLWQDFPKEDVVMDDDDTNDNDIYQYNTRSMISNTKIGNSTTNDEIRRARSSRLNSSATTNSYLLVSPHTSSSWITDESTDNYNIVQQNRTRATRALQGIVTLDVMFVVTNRALCEYIKLYHKDTNPKCLLTAANMAPMDDRIQIIVAETNKAMTSINVQLRLVRVMYFDETSTFDPIANGTGFQAVAANTDIKNARDASGADLVAAIAGVGGLCGIAGHNTWRSVTSQACMKQYTVSHEIGHNINCNHNREVIPNGGDPNLYSYGYLNTIQRYRTFLSYDCSGSSCPRVPYFSSSTLTLPDGRVLGTSSIDNLRQISDRAPVVANWKAAIAPPVPFSPPIKPTTSPVSLKPSLAPNSNPTVNPINKPTFSPTGMPINNPTVNPISIPTNVPIFNPTFNPTTTPIWKPTYKPTLTHAPTTSPTKEPTFLMPTTQPTFPKPSTQPTFLKPTTQPTFPEPTPQPTNKPPTQIPTQRPILIIVDIVTGTPTNNPINPTNNPVKPTNNPINPTNFPIKPTNNPLKPTNNPILPAKRPKPTKRRAPRRRIFPILFRDKPSQLLGEQISTIAPTTMMTTTTARCTEVCTSTKNSGQVQYKLYQLPTRTGQRCKETCVIQSRIVEYTTIGYQCGMCRTSTVVMGRTVPTNTVVQTITMEKMMMKSMGRAKRGSM